MMDISRILQVLRPGAEWAMSGNDYSKLVWMDKVQTKPTEDEVKKALADYVPLPAAADRISTLEAQVASLLHAQAAPKGAP